LNPDPPTPAAAAPEKFFYGWYIVAVGFLSHVVCAFNLSSTLSVFLKPLTEDLGVSRGLFSLLRSGEILISALLAPFVGVLVDRYGGRWLMVGGALLAGVGFILLSQATAFWQFLVIRWLFVTVGGVFMCSIVVTVTISRWFVKKRGRAIAIATLGQGASKVGIPLLAASLFVWLGWRQTWAVFGVLTLVLVVIPALIFLRHSPEEMHLQPDGMPAAQRPMNNSPIISNELSGATEVAWTRGELLKSSVFWLLCITFGIANIGIAGLNLHVFAYISDIGYSSFTAATVMSIIAFTQLGSTLFWGFVSERVESRKAAMLMFLIQGTGLAIAIATDRLPSIYAGFFLYGVGLGGSIVLQEVIWANYYGRVSLGTVRGLAVLITFGFGALGAPFFGFLFDATGSYMLSFVLFSLALLLSAVLSRMTGPPKKEGR
jgi:MFS family permease